MTSPDSDKPSRALVTGGAGFIGSHLSDEILKRGHTVVAIDDLSTGSDANVAHLEGNRRFELVIGSILDEKLVDSLVEQADCVFHLASAVGVKTIMDHPVSSLTTNVIGTNVVLKAASRLGRRMIITSSSEVYGKSEELPYREDSNPVIGLTTRARWGYACAKATCEFLAMAYHKDQELPVVVVRLFNVIGTRQSGRYGMVVPRFVQQALQGKPLTVFGDGEQTRSFINVKDAVGAILSLFDESSIAGDVFNIGIQNAVTIKDLALLVKKVSGSSSQLRFIPPDKVYGNGFEDISHRTPDISKLADAIGFEPSVSLEESIKQVIEYYRGSLP